MKLSHRSFGGTFLHIAILLVLAFFPFKTVHALESYEINSKILSKDSNIFPEWINDEENPWIFSNDSTYISTPAHTGTNFITTISIKFYSEYEVYVSYNESHWSYTGFSVRFDGEEDYPVVYNGYKLPAGEHQIDFEANLGYTDHWARINSITLREFKPLESTCLAEDSMPLTFENDPDNPWMAYDGYIRSMCNTADHRSFISTTFTIDELSIFSWEFLNRWSGTWPSALVYINDELYQDVHDRNQKDWYNNSVVLYPGTYTIKFGNWHQYKEDSYTQIRNVRLSQNWIEANLSAPGELGVRLLHSLNGKNLQDAELVKIKGSLNADDWKTIGQLTNIKAVDFTETDITSIPANAFQNTSLSTVMMPETVSEIGDGAFIGTKCYEINIPASVETIGNQAWERTPIAHINFAENSKLKKIGKNAFYQTKLIEFIMPNTVKDSYSVTDEWRILYDCDELIKVHLSDSLTTVPRETVWGCDKLAEANIPACATSIGYEAYAGNNMETIIIPELISSIGQQAFYNSHRVKKVVLNSNVNNIDGTFNGCTTIDTIIVASPTPPTIKSDPFNKADKTNVTLIVPDFAIDSYRTDSYWYNFTNTVAGDEASLRDYWTLRGKLTLDNNHLMQGSPSVEMMTGSTLTILDDAAQNFNEFTYQTQESSPASFLSRSNNLNANSLTTKFYVAEANKWFFFSPVCDINMADISYPSSDSWVIRYYDGARRASEDTSSGNWINVSADGKLMRGQGYIIQATAAGWLNMPVTPENHTDFFGSNEATLPLVDNVCENQANTGWNFVANTYPCYYDAYYMDVQSPLTVWTGSTYRAYVPNDGDNLMLRPMQPFFVQKTAADMTATMPLAGRSVNSSTSRAPRVERYAANPNRNILNLELKKVGKEEADDYTRIVINEDASFGYELNCDASKFMSMDAEIAQMFSFGLENQPMAINERPYGDGNVALGFYFPKSGETFSITATRSDRQAWIYDAHTGLEQDLTEGDYVFTAAKTGYDYNRFSIRFSPSASGVDCIDNTPTQVSSGKGFISIKAPESASVAVYASDGTVVANMVGASVINVSAGVYVVKVNEESFKTIVK
ncbi:MAG: leucine-rich repeat domain-containing protein [Muribaculum sp.]|nr:leucine-rich repeat domain-containing protein [Muribaculum sp.]